VLRSESSSSRDAVSHSTSASNSLAAANGSSSLSSIVPSIGAAADWHCNQTVLPKTKTRLEEMISSRQTWKPRSPVQSRGPTLTEAYMSSMQQMQHRPAQHNSMLMRPDGQQKLSAKTTNRSSSSRLASMLPESVRQSALKRQSYLDQLLHEADARSMAAAAAATDDDDADHPQTSQASHVTATAMPVAAQQTMPPRKPSSNVTSTTAAVSNQFYQSPFLFKPTADVAVPLQVPASSYKASFQHGASSSLKKADVACLADRQWTVGHSQLISGDEHRSVEHNQPVGGHKPRSGAGGHSDGGWQRSQPAVSRHSSADRDRTQTICSSSGVKPASHHEPGRHKSVLPSTTHSVTVSSHVVVDYSPSIVNSCMLSRHLSLLKSPPLNYLLYLTSPHLTSPYLIPTQLNSTHVFFAIHLFLSVLICSSQSRYFS